MLARMLHAICIRAHGGPEVLEWQPVEVGEPGPTEARVRHTAVGLNFIDIYQRTGLYPASLPVIPGREAAGVVEAVGARVRHVAPGDRVAYVSSTPGAYAEQRVLDAAQLVKLPDGISDEQAAAVMLKGLTAYMLVRRVHRLRSRETVLIHAAAGGVGLLTVQWAAHLGARVIGVVSSPDKAALARRHGATEVLLTDEDWVARTRAFTRGQGVEVVYDSVGKATFAGSLDCLAPRGLLVTFGNSSGPPPAIEPLELGRRGSLFLTRPTVFDYTRTPAELARAARELFDLVQRGVLSVHIGQRYPLADAARAHADLEARRTVGSTVLTVNAP